MAENEASKLCSKQTTKRGKFSRKDKKQVKQTKSAVQPRLPKTASEVSSNWKALAAVIESNREQSRSFKRRRPRNNSKQFTDNKSKQKRKELVEKKRVYSGDIKSGKDEIWFDDVDPDVIEKATGVKQRKLCEDYNVHSHAHTCGEMPQNEQVEQEPSATKHVAMDCEFVGVGKDGSEHMLARVSIVNNSCGVLYDKYVAAQEKVVDYRTDVSGIRPSHLKNAPKFTDVQKDVAALLKDKILIGHSISSDLKVLLLDHPRKRIRDTARYKPFQEKVKGTKIKEFMLFSSQTFPLIKTFEFEDGRTAKKVTENTNSTKRPSLKKLAKEILSLSIQSGEHSSVEDARAAMKLYVTHRKEWEKSIKDRFRKTKQLSDCIQR